MAEEMKRKSFIAKTDIDSEERTVTAVISTNTVDRDAEILLPKGIELENYLKNPVVLFGHNYSGLPVGKALWVKKGTKSIKAKVKFADTDMGNEIYELFKGGYLNAFSVGFSAQEGHAPKPEEIKKNPEWANARFIFDKWELLEFSAVPVPANPEALATAVKSKSVTMSNDIKELLEIDTEETFYPEKKEAEPEVPVEVWKKEVEQKVEKELVELFKPEEPIEIKKHIQLVRFIDPKEIAKVELKKIRGKMY